MIDYLNDINESDLREYAQKMYQEEIEKLAFWEYDPEENERNISELFEALKELQEIVKKDNNNALAILYYYIVNKYLE